jgi:hypothetical protein
MRTACFAAGLALLLALPAAAQEPRTVVGVEKVHGFFGAPVVKFTELGDDFAFMPGGRVGWLAGHELALGAGAYFSTGDASLQDDFGASRDLRLQYAGFEAEIIFFWDYTYHMTLSLLLGGGRLEVDGDGESVGVVEPLANLEINLLPGFRIDLGGGYRAVWGVDASGVSASDAGGFVGAVAFKIGSY